MPADYQLVDPPGAFIYNATYSRTFVAARDPLSSPYFEMWVKTGYSSGGNAASVRINGTEIDKVWPRPWTNHNYIDMEVVAFVFSWSLLNQFPGPPWVTQFPMPNTLEIVPMAGGTNYLWVENVIYHFRA
jgi:hypothetical protein